MSIAALIIFCAGLLTCVILNQTIIYAMLAGMVIFSAYTLIRGFSFRELCRMIADGVGTAKNVLIAMGLIGIMTALWRSCGTIPAMVTYSAGLIKPEIFVLVTFLLNCLVSFLIGTSLGTAATMGIICMTVGLAAGVNPSLTGGAILSGVYFGDRCSPVSTSALLVSELTGTNLYENIKNMMKSALIPFIITCIVYYILGLKGNTAGAATDVSTVFAGDFVMNVLVLIPAVVIIVLALFRLNVKISISVSIVTAFVIAVLVQHRAIGEILLSMVTGFKSGNPAIAQMIDGGGLISMLNVIIIITCSCAYSGIFKGTGLIEDFKTATENLSKKITPHGATLVVSVMTTMIGSNQTLATILTNNLCSELVEDKKKFALMLEDTVILVAALIPWSTACAAALSSSNAPVSSIPYAVYLYILPACSLIVSLIREKHKK